MARSLDDSQCGDEDGEGYLQWLTFGKKRTEEDVNCIQGLSSSVLRVRKTRKAYQC